MSIKKMSSRVGAVVAAAAIALGLMVGGCGGDDDNPGNGGGSGHTATLSGDILTTNKDGKKYRTVVIGGKRWMAENLNYATASDRVSYSWCYDDDASNCAKYGRLYNWNAATSACPAGWRLPDTADWSSLVQAAGGWTVAGEKLKSKTGWNDYQGASGNGTDEFGFSALPGGTFIGYFSDVGNIGRWRSATEDGSVYAFTFHMGNDRGSVMRFSNMYEYGFSVRCLQN